MLAAVTARCGLSAHMNVALDFVSNSSQRGKTFLIREVDVTGILRNRMRNCRLCFQPPFAERPWEPGQSSEVQSLATKNDMGLLDTSIESTTEHRLWLGFGTSASIGMIVKAGVGVHSAADVAGICFAAMAGYTLADLGTGIYHWGVDNYGDAMTPVFGSQIDAFQGHHRRPWTITKRQFSNNLQAIARPVGYALLPFLLLPTNTIVDTFLGVFLGLIILSQQFHAWAHCKKSQLPFVVDFLQEHGILISRKMHGLHHKAPYSLNYCIVSGFWNPILNNSNFFPQLERAIYLRWTVVPRNWIGTAPEWTQDGSYFEDGSDVKFDREL